MADMHRTGRVGGHVFDIDLCTVADGAVPILPSSMQNGAQRLDPGGRLERQIDEARARHLDLVDKGVGPQAIADCISKLARLLAGILGQHHGGIGRHVAVIGIARRLDYHTRLVDAGRQHPGRHQGSVGGPHLVENSGKNVLIGHTFGLGVLARVTQICDQVKARSPPPFSAEPVSKMLLPQFRRPLEQPLMLDQSVAVGHPGDEIGGGAQPGGFVAGRRAAGPFGWHLVGTCRIAVEQVAHDTLGIRHDTQDARVPIHARVKKDRPPPLPKTRRPVPLHCVCPRRSGVTTRRGERQSPQSRPRSAW